MQNPKVIQQAVRHWCAFLKEFRQSQNLTMEEVGRRMALLENRKEPYTKQYINYIESGSSSIGLDLFFRYCTAVGARPVLQLMKETDGQFEFFSLMSLHCAKLC